jgi:hypothetical protein
MPHSVPNRQKPIWKQIRKPIPPPGRPQTSKKGKKAYDRKDKSWKTSVS